MAEEIPYKPGTKSYLVAQRMLEKGIPDDKASEKQFFSEIVKDMKVKEKTVRNVKSLLKKRGLLGTSSGTTPSPTSPTSPDPSPKENLGDVPKGIIQQPSSTKTLPRIPTGLPRETMIEVEGFPVGKKINLTPKNLTMIDWFISKYGYEGGYSDVINECIEDFFIARGYRLKVIKEEEV